MAQELLVEADSYPIPCKGFGEKGEFAANPNRQEKACGGKTCGEKRPAVLKLRVLYWQSELVFPSQEEVLLHANTNVLFHSSYVLA